MRGSCCAKHAKRQAPEEAPNVYKGVCLSLKKSANRYLSNPAIPSHLGPPEAASNWVKCSALRPCSAKVLNAVGPARNRNADNSMYLKTNAIRAK